MDKLTLYGSTIGGVTFQNVTPHPRMNNNRILIIPLLLSIFFSTAVSCHARNNVSKHIEYIGNPYSQYYKTKESIYARNIWDIVGYKGKVYFGAGNSSNMGPSPNAGPVPIMSYDPETNSFNSVFTTNEEQIDQFYLFDNILYSPGHDPTEDWNHGNVYISRDGQQWQKKRTIPFGIHTYCLHVFKDRLFAGLGTLNGAAVAISDDLGASWDLSVFKRTMRFYNFLEVNDKLYIIGLLMGDEYKKTLEERGIKQTDAIFEYSESMHFSPRRDISSRELFPNTSLNKNQAYKVIRSQRVTNKSIYLGGYIHNDHQSIPFGLYIAESLTKDNISVKKVPLPDNVVPWDIYQSEDYVYILTNKKLGNTNEAIILRSNNLEEWYELFYFESPEFVRSFTLHQGIFYFSLGCEIADPQNWNLNELTKQTGDILKLDLFSIQ